MFGISGLAELCESQRTMLVPLNLHRAVRGILRFFWRTGDLGQERKLPVFYHMGRTKHWLDVSNGLRIHAQRHP